MTPPDDLAAVAKLSADFRREVDDKLHVFWLTQNTHVRQQCEDFLVEQFETALVAQRALGRQELDLWDIGRADELSRLMAEFVRWVECDLAAHGPGPSDGYVKRLEDAKQAVQLVLALHHRVDAAESQVSALTGEIARLREALERHGQHTDECGVFFCATCGEPNTLYHREEEEHPFAPRACTCGLSLLLAGAEAQTTTPP